jgi:hypothetical protein
LSVELHLLNDDWLIRVPRPALIITQGFQQVVLTLAGPTRHRLLSGKISTVADVAMVLLRQRPSTLEPA